MYKQYFKQAWNLMRQNRFYSGVYIIGTGLAISMVMVIAIVYHIRTADITPEVHRGKYLYIDVWATWCSPCREEIPYMARLYEHFAKDKRIALVSISVDSNVKTWEQFIEREKPAWAQYVVDRKTNAFLDKEYRIYGIPHFMLIDPEGRFIAYSFSRPSEPDCAALIENSMK